MGPRQRTLATFTALMLAAGCRQATTPAAPGSGTGPAPTASRMRPAPSPDELANATYTGIVADVPVTLSHGAWESAPAPRGGTSRPRVELLGALHVTGDLAGDAAEEAVALLASSGGGSSTLQTLVVVGREGEGIAQLAAVPLGDRVQVKALRVDARHLVAEVVRRGERDPHCCPTERARLTWRVDGGMMTAVGNDAIGALGLADLEGPEWTLTHWGVDEPLEGDVVPTLSVSGGRFAGSAGCNRYTAAVEAKEAGRFAVTRVVSTRMACPPPGDAVERRFLDLLPMLHGIQFLAGDLLLTHDDGVLRFRAHQASRSAS